MVMGSGSTGIMDAHDANVRKYGEKKANRMLYRSFGGFVLFWILLFGGLALFG